MSCKKQLYDVTFKVLSFELKNNSKVETLSVNVRFAEKLFRIRYGDEKEVNDLEKVRETIKKSKTSDCADQDNPCQAKKGNCEQSGNKYPQRSSKKESCADKAGKKPRSSTLSSRRQGCKPSVDESVGTFNCGSEDSICRGMSERIIKKQDLCNDCDNSCKQENQEFFGSKTMQFEALPYQMAEKLGEHCIKYEISQNCNLLGKKFLN